MNWWWPKPRSCARPWWANPCAKAVCARPPAPTSSACGSAGNSYCPPRTRCSRTPWLWLLPVPTSRSTPSIICWGRAIPPSIPAADASVVILGCGRVGLAAARQLHASGREYSIVDKNPKPRVQKEHMVVGDAADLDVLEKAGIRTAPSVLITTHDDDTNIYLTLYCRRLREDIQIISRATLDRNVGILHAAGADLVLSWHPWSQQHHQSAGSRQSDHDQRRSEHFPQRRGQSLAGKPLMGSGIRSPDPFAAWWPARHGRRNAYQPRSRPRF